jgi:hypothetical protein
VQDFVCGAGLCRDGGLPGGVERELKHAVNEPNTAKMAPSEEAANPADGALAEQGMAGSAADHLARMKITGEMPSPENGRPFGRFAVGLKRYWWINARTALTSGRSSHSSASRVSVPHQRATARCGRDPEKPTLRSTAQRDDAPPMAEHDPDPVGARASAAECGPVAVIDDLACGGVQDVYPSLAHDLAPSATAHRTAHHQRWPRPPARRQGRRSCAVEPIGGWRRPSADLPP